MSSAGRDRTGQEGTGGDSIDNLSPSLWLLAWLGSALAEVCQHFYIFCQKIVNCKGGGMGRWDCDFQTLPTVRFLTSGRGGG